jgi:long-chain acyl-CoA synthetase
MDNLINRLKRKFELPIGGGSLLGMMIKTYKTLDDPILLKMKDEKGDYTREYRTSDILRKGYAFSKIHKDLSGHNVAYISDNHIDIVSLEFGCWMNKKYTTGFYKSDSLEDISFKIHDSDVDIMIVDGPGWESIKDLPLEIKERLKVVFFLEGTLIPENKNGFKNLKNLELKADLSVIDDLEYEDPDVVGDNIVKVVYTSGSTGKPKGVPLTNKNCLYACYGFIHEIFKDTDEREITAFFLPNAHIFQTAIMGLAYSSAYLAYITTKETIKDDLPKINPTFLFGVPLLYQKMAQKVELKLTSMLGGFFKEKDLISPTWKNKLFIRPIFSKMVKKKMGLTRVKTIFCAGAALNSKTYDFYEHTLGIKVSGAYGLSETTATLSTARVGKKGASGKVAVIDIVEIRNKNEEGVGEIWAKGKNIFSGYLNANNRDDFDDQGFFKTGDLGLIDDDGYVFIKGRIKNFHKGADGRFYNIEGIAEKVLDKGFHIQQVAIHILDAPFPTALVTLGEECLDFENYKKDKHLLGQIKKECHEIILELEKEKYHPIPKHFIFTSAYTEENGLLTPTKKIKVSKVLAFYEKGIIKFHEEKDVEFSICSNDQTLTHF